MHWSDVSWVSSGSRKNSSGRPYPCLQLLNKKMQRGGNQILLCRCTGQEARLEHRRFPSLTRQNYFNYEAGQIPEWGSWEAVESPSPEILKTQQDKALSNLTLLDPLWTGEWSSRCPPDIPSNPNYSVILNNPSENCEFNLVMDNVSHLKLCSLKQLLKLLSVLRLDSAKCKFVSPVRLDLLLKKSVSVTTIMMNWLEEKKLKN